MGKGIKKNSVMFSSRKAQCGVRNMKTHSAERKGQSVKEQNAMRYALCAMRNLF